MTIGVVILHRTENSICHASADFILMERSRELNGGLIEVGIDGELSVGQARWLHFST